jgi:hypothetical protein
VDQEGRVVRSSDEANNNGRWRKWRLLGVLKKGGDKSLLVRVDYLRREDRGQRKGRDKKKKKRDEEGSKYVYNISM